MTGFDTSLNDVSTRITWDGYRGNRAIFDKLQDVQQFALDLVVPPIPEMTDNKFAMAIATSIYAHVRDAVRDAHFFATDELTISTTATSARIQYNDDRFDFTVDVADGRIVIGRSGSNFADFHGFYSRISEHLPALVSKIRKEVADRTRRDCDVSRASFVFNFLLYGLAHTSSNRRVRNSEVMRRVIVGVPGDDGALANSDDVLASAGRVDVNISRWVPAPNSAGMRLERYTLEAPANKEGAALFAKFAYGGETYTNPSTQDRVNFNADLFLEEHDRAYVGFLRNKAIDGFLGSLLKDYTFKSSSYTLP